MAVKMRLRREGKRKQPFYRVVVADVRSPRDGRFIDDLGFYQPLSEPSAISIDHERALYWLRNGVQPSDAVRKLLRIEGIWEEFKPGDPGRDRGVPPAAKATAPAGADRDAAQAETQQAEAQPQHPTEQADDEAVEQAKEEVAQPGNDRPAGDESAEAGPGGRAESDVASEGKRGSSS